MKIAVFGGSGRTGVHIVEQALAQGHHVTALVRDPNKLPIKHTNLTVIQGDALNADQVAATIKGADAVISALGPTKTSPKDLLSASGQNIINAMKKHSVKRFIGESGAGVVLPEDPQTFGSRVMGALVGMMIKDVIADNRQQLAQLRASGLDWTLVRAPVLNNGPRTGNYNAGYQTMGPGAKISRADIAEFMLKQTNDKTYVGQAPTIRY